MIFCRKTYATFATKRSDPKAAPFLSEQEGTVRGVDDIGSVMVAWDNGCGLNVVLDDDEIEIIEGGSNR